MSESQQVFYYIIVFFSMVYAFYRVGITRDSILVVLIFWSGLFQYVDRVIDLPLSINNSYKILVVIYALYITGDNYFKKLTNNEQFVNVAFILFSISFWISYLLYGGGIFTIMSQYVYKYGLVYIVFHYMKVITFNEHKREYIKGVILCVLYIQVFLSVVKLSLIGIQSDAKTYEAIVGSISAGGAGSAVVIPIVALIFYWVITGGRFTRKDWLVAISFLIIAIASAKRQPILLFPMVLYALFMYVTKGFNIKSALKYAPLIFLLFYTGVKLHPSFNPENKVWGSFDIQHVRNYISQYYFGTENIHHLLLAGYGIDTGTGRGSGFVYYFQPQKLNLIETQEVLFGKGRYEVATQVHGRFTGAGRADYGIDHRGLMGEAGALLYSFGYVGAIFLFLFAYSIIRTCPNRRISLIILLYYLWDFLFYYNQVVFSNASALLVVYICFYTSTGEKDASMFLTAGVYHDQ